MRIKDTNKEISIREKAIEMIVSDGFDGLSMQRLAQAAGVSPATIYIYFKHREDLLNQLYNYVQQTFSDTALKGFKPDLPLKKGLWLQWKNRLQFVLQYPNHYLFYEQFRNSPLINHCDIKSSDFKENMKAFMLHSIKNGELKQMEPELFWSIAYGPFYSLIRFQSQGKTMMNNHFTLSEAKLKQAFNMVITALQPKQDS